MLKGVVNLNFQCYLKLFYSKLTLPSVNKQFVTVRVKVHLVGIAVNKWFNFSSSII